MTQGNLEMEDSPQINGWFSTKTQCQELERQMVQWLKALVALTDDLGSGPRTHMAAHNHL